MTGENGIPAAGERKEVHRRSSIRLKGYDYTWPGAYFVTVCTHRQAPLFGEVVNGEMMLNEFGRIVWEEWFRTAQVRSYVALFAEEFVVMPNHVHGIIWIVDTPIGARRRRAPTTEKFGKPVPGSIPTIVRSLKSAVTRRINALLGTPGARVWQRNYYEHIIRSERALEAIRRYILQNPLRWHLDRYNPDAVGPDPQARALWNLLREDARTRPRGAGNPAGRDTASLRPYEAL